MRRASAGSRWATRPSPGLPDLVDGQHHPGLGVVVVVGDGDRPRHRRQVRVVGDHRVLRGVERVVVDRAAHGCIQPRTEAPGWGRLGRAGSLAPWSAPTPRSSVPADGSPTTGCRSGSCARPGGRCPSTGPSAGTGLHRRRPSARPTWPPRSRSSRSAATAPTPPSSTPTSSRPSRPSASASTSSPASGPVVAAAVPRRPTTWSGSGRSIPRPTRPTCSRPCATWSASWATCR